MYRLSHTRKFSRTHTNQDLLNILLVSSDPLISSLQKTPRKKSKSFSADVIALLKMPDIPQTITQNEESENDETSDEE